MPRRTFDLETTSSQLQQLIDQAKENMSDVQRRDLSSQIRRIITKMPARAETQDLYNAGMRVARMLNRQITENALRELHTLNGELAERTRNIIAITELARSEVASSVLGAVADALDDANAIHQAIRDKKYEDALVYAENIVTDLTTLIRDLSAAK